MATRVECDKIRYDNENTMLKVNQYFEGKVASIALQTANLPATVGVMDIGEYEFETIQHEVMTVVSGEMNVKLPETDQWLNVTDGNSFKVAAKQTFKLKVPIQTAYFCTYRDN